MKELEPNLFPIIIYPVSLMVHNCRHAARIDHPAIDEKSRLCLKPEKCSCLFYGKTLQDDLLDPTRTRDDLDRFIDGDRFDLQPDDEI
jgi:hypothetical protein